MKVSMFHLMPHRELPEDFEQRYHSVWVDPPWWELADAERVGQYYNWTLDELTHAAKAGHGWYLRQRASPERLWLHAEPQPDGLRYGQGHQRPGRGHCADGLDPADDQPSYTGRRRVRHAGLHQRWASGRRYAPGLLYGRKSMLRHSAHRATRPVL